MTGDATDPLVRIEAMIAEVLELLREHDAGVRGVDVSSHDAPDAVVEVPVMPSPGAPGRRRLPQ